jgi:hypothetical protein
MLQVFEMLPVGSDKREQAVQVDNDIYGEWSAVHQGRHEEHRGEHERDDRLFEFHSLYYNYIQVGYFQAAQVLVRRLLEWFVHFSPLFVSILVYFIYFKLKMKRKCYAFTTISS